MRINFFLIPFVIILGLMLGYKDNAKKRLFFIIVCSIVLIFVAAMRSPEWLSSVYHLDTLNYKWMFEDSFDMTWNEFRELVYLRYVGHVNENDIGYMALNKLIGLVTRDFHIFSLLADLIFFIPFGIILYRYTTSVRQIMFAFVFYISLVQVFFLGGARQIFALGFDMIALLSVVGKKRVWAIVFVILAISIHFSSILFVVPLLMIANNFHPTRLKLIHIICFILFPVVLTFPNELIVFMGNTLGMEKYAQYGMSEIQGGIATFILLIEALSIFCLIAIKSKDLRSNESMHIFYTMAPLFTLFAPFIRSNGSMIRISLYFHLFLSLLVPYGIECMFKNKDKKFVYAIAIGALAFLTLSNGGIVYYFYWQA